MGFSEGNINLDDLDFGEGNVNVDDLDFVEGNVYLDDQPICDDQWGTEEATVACRWGLHFEAVFEFLVVTVVVSKPVSPGCLVILRDIQGNALCMGLPERTRNLA